MRLLLISLQSNAYITGLKYIAANARAHGHNVRLLLLPGYLENKLSPAIEDFILDYSPDLIGVGLMSIEFYPAKNLTRLLKEKFNIPVIWGGVHVILNPEECLKYADYTCCADGERAVVSLLEHLRTKGRDIAPEIPNVWTRINGQISKQPIALPEKDLDSLPFQEYLPDYFYGFHKEGIYNFAQNQRLFRKYALYGGTCHMMLTTRGCPFKCAYCGNSAFMSIYGKNVRERSVANVIAELKEVKKNPYVLYINIQDDCFFAHNREWIKEFCREYKKHINLPFLVRVIPTMMDREKLFMLRGAGLSWIVMGIQSGSDRVNFEVYNRKIRFTSVEKAAGIIAETSAAPFYELIVDNPYETEDEKRETITAVSQLKRPYTASLAHLTFFPGTPLAERAVKDNIVSPDAYLYRYIVKIDKTYLNKLLDITPYIPKTLVKFLNKPEASRRITHQVLLNSLVPVIKRTIEPAVYFFITTRALDYNISWTIRTVRGGWRSAISRVIFNFLGKGDLKYDQKMEWARKNMPALFEN
ncbi:MAG: B12-binding domain-containing radical SAM protein [Nitrospirae bacterium]|nr:B12-binding domain-containing radical SAM protein [Nitrospirota bacterium]